MRSLCLMLLKYVQRISQKKDTLFRSTVRLKWLSKIERYRRLRRKKSPETLIKQTLPGSKRKL